jgi:acyl-CoA thioester hydrolase
MMETMPFRCPIEVRFKDLDAMGHVNNAVLVTYLELARVRIWERYLGHPAALSEIPFIVARVAIDYRSPVVLGENVEVGIGVSAIGRTSYTFAYRVEAAGRLAAEAETVQVLFDYAARTPVPIDERLRAWLESVAIPGSWIAGR